MEESNNLIRRKWEQQSCLDDIIDEMMTLLSMHRIFRFIFRDDIEKMRWTRSKIKCDIFIFSRIYGIQFSLLRRCWKNTRQE